MCANNCQKIILGQKKIGLSYMIAGIVVVARMLLDLIPHDRLALAMVDGNRKRSIEFLQHDRVVPFPLVLVQPQDGIVPPTCDEEVILERGDRVQVLHWGTSCHDPPISAVEVNSLHAIQVGVHPVAFVTPVFAGWV